MTFPRYPKYWGSGVEWLGEIPDGWAVSPYKRMIDIQNGVDYKHVEQSEGYPVIGSGGIFTYASEYLYDGESVLLGRKGTIDKPLYVSGRFWTVDTMYWSIILDGTHPRFAYYTALIIPFDYYSTNTAVPSMTKGSLCAHLVACPPSDEQIAIATFLDRETAKIDDLVSDQEKLIELLQEKRQALISHAVTKGINPDAPMKDSGVEWLGEVPEHWEVTHLKYSADLIVDCPHETPTYADDGPYKVIRTADISLGRLDQSNTFSLDEAEYLRRTRRQDLRQDDIVYGREGERWGFAALIPKDNLYCLGQRMMQFRASNNTCPSFLMWQLNSVSTYRQGQMDTVGATSPHVNVGTIRNYFLTNPPKAEQIVISDFLARETAKLDFLIDDSRQSIELLKERRTALISAAVTGKMDVRTEISAKGANG